MRSKYFLDMQSCPPIADWLVYNEKANQKDLRELILAQGGTDCLLPAYGKWIGLLWSGSAKTTEKTERGKTIRAHQPLPSHLYLPQSQRDEEN